MDNARWTKMLKLATGCPCDISPRWLLEMRYGDYTGADLARELHIVLGNTVRDPIHERMRATAGGCEGNGIQLWRGPFREFEGGDVVVQNHMGVQFPAFKQCKDIRNLSKTLDDWFGVASKACQQRDDECLRTMSVGILPPDLKADGNKRVMLDLGTSDNVFKYANQQVAHMRSEQLADHPGKHVQPLTQPQQQQQADNNMPALADTGLVVNQDSLVQAVTHAPPPRRPQQGRPSRVLRVVLEDLSPDPRDATHSRAIWMSKDAGTAVPSTTPAGGKNKSLICVLPLEDVHPEIRKAKLKDPERTRIRKRSAPLYPITAIAMILTPTKKTTIAANVHSLAAHTSLLSSPLLPRNRLPRRLQHHQIFRSPDTVFTGIDTNKKLAKRMIEHAGTAKPTKQRHRRHSHDQRKRQSSRQERQQRTKATTIIRHKD